MRPASRRAASAPPQQASTSNRSCRATGCISSSSAPSAPRRDFRIRASPPRARRCRSSSARCCRSRFRTPANSDALASRANVRALIIFILVVLLFGGFNWLTARQLFRLHPRRKRIVVALLAAGNLMWLFLPWLRVRTDAMRAVPLTLCAHSHGGQFGIRPLRWTLAGLFIPYHIGLYQRGASQLYVHTGAGYWLLPWRLGITPEIVIVELRAFRPHARGTTKAPPRARVPRARARGRGRGGRAGATAGRHPPPRRAPGGPPPEALPVVSPGRVGG